MRRPTSLGPLFTLLIVAAGLLLRDSPARAAVAPVDFLPDVSSWVVTSKASHQTYEIWVALPSGYGTQHAPYPVLYAADANAEFGIVVGTARLLALAKMIPDVIVVGVGYPLPGQGFKASSAARSLDLTPPANAAALRALADIARTDGDPVPAAIGGAPAFLSFLRTELVPSIQAKYNASATDRALFGHSFGGLFGSYALLNNDGLFQRFLIGSPSLWWNQDAMLQAEKSFAATHRTLPVRLYLAVGGEEESKEFHMVSNLQTFSEQLTAHAYAGLTFKTEVMEGENHLSVIPTTVSRGLRFIYSTPNCGGLRGWLNQFHVIACRSS